MNRDVVGVVLAGGRSRRMGRDKALLAIDGSLMVERAASVLANLCAECVLAVGPGRRYDEFSLVHVEDQRPDSGPLAGLEAVLAWAAPRDVLVLACDLPRVDVSVFERLLSARESEVAEPASAWLACRDERIQPLCGVYSSGCRGIFERLLDRGERSVLDALASIDSRHVFFDDLDADPFVNVNTPDDYARAGGQLVTR